MYKIKFLIFFIFILTIDLYSQTCPRYDRNKNYVINECVYYDSPIGGRNYFSEHDNNRGNPPDISSWWWDECSVNDVNCMSQYTDSIITCTDTIYDTLTVTNTTTFVDTNIFYDTVLTLDTFLVVDTIIHLDTNILNQTVIVYDTTYILDTNLIYDTLYTDTIVNDTITMIDTVYNLINVYDTIIKTVNVKDTFILMDTILKSHRYDLIDTIRITGLNDLKITLPEGVIKEDVKYEIDINYDYLNKDDVVELEIKGYIFDQLGQYVNKVNEKIKIEHDGFINETLSLVAMKSKNGYLYNGSGRKIGNGSYIVQIYVIIKINEQIDNTVNTLNIIGYKRK